jgi:hypothetical protein
MKTNNSHPLKAASSPRKRLSEPQDTKSDVDVKRKPVEVQANWRGGKVTLLHASRWLLTVFTCITTTRGNQPEESWDRWITKMGALPFVSWILIACDTECNANTPLLTQLPVLVFAVSAIVPRQKAQASKHYPLVERGPIHTALCVEYYLLWSVTTVEPEGARTRALKHRRNTASLLDHAICSVNPGLIELENKFLVHTLKGVARGTRRGGTRRTTIT